MSISCLSVHSDLSHEHWILKNYNNSTQDKHQPTHIESNLSHYNPNYYYYYWDIIDSDQFKYYFKNNFSKDGETYFLDDNLTLLSRSLSIYMNEWFLSISSVYSSHQINKLNSNILILIRDSLFLRTHNILKCSKYRGVHSFIIYSKRDFSLYDHFLKLCKNSFWLCNKHGKQLGGSEFTNESILGSIYTVDFDHYSSVSFSNFCFTKRNYLVTCCCERCTRVLHYLDKNHKDSASNTHLKNLLLNEHNSLIQFFIHNRKYSNLEYKLLQITFNGLAINKSTTDQFYSILRGSESGLKSLFRSCFVLCKNFELLNNYSSEKTKNPLSMCSLALDLLCEYSELWEELELPIFSFIFLPIENVTSTNSEPMNHESLYSNPFHILHNSTHFKYSNLVHDEEINENSKVEFFKDLLETSSKNQASYNSDTLRSLLILTRGYSLEDLRVLTRLAKCESAKDKCENFREDLVKYFEKAVSLKPMTDFSNILGLCPEISSFSNFLNFGPLKLQNGEVVYRKGLEALLINPETLDKLNCFMFQRLGTDSLEPKNNHISLAIQGDSGVGKTTLAYCLAQEMNSLFFPVNVLSFLRPQVGLSEKLLHSFISKIRNRFCGSATGIRKDLVKCVILLEGLEALNGKEGYLKRFVSGLRFELDDIISQSKFASDYSILFVTTCQRLSDLPEKIGKVFTEVIEIDTPEMDDKFTRGCFELFLNLRCDFLDRMDDLLEHINKKNYSNKLTPLKIATISRNATLRAITESSDIFSGEMCASQANIKANVVRMDTVISLLDSSLK